MDSHGAASPGTCVGVMEGVQLVGNVASGSWEVPQILPPFPPTTFLLLTVPPSPTTGTPRVLKLVIAQVNNGINARASADAYRYT